ncbi:hypothetical protein ERO13_D13G190800v2 [Gossypium hirsutum]|uniref:Reticulon-like protein B21 isoform X2 n=1 Tax=Gossypium hirsutum TaxID=3635 RepID=A0A1U8HVP8_GOSHI|nr:reticulon-like protein B21 isoform X2 [Gossypium hirsutum]KAG4112895.1 hypothetical protein ERO13_D13G190800v2 [Gossypium hirsutum]
MDLSYRRLGVKSNVVAAGSVWETRMKSDEFRGGIKVFNGEDEDEEEESINVDGDKRLKKGQSVGGSKRKTWKNESFDGFKKNPIKVVAKGRSMEHCKDLSLAVVDNGIKKKSPVQVKKGRSDGNERNPILMRKQRSQVHKRTAKTDSNGNEDLGLDSIEENEKNPVETDKVESETEESNDEHGVCQDKTISSCADNGDTVKSSPEPLLDDDAHGDGDGDGVEDDEEQIEEENGIEVENEKKSFDIKEMNVQEDKKLPKIDIQVKKSPEEKPNKAINEMKKVHEDKGSNVVNQVKKFSQFHNKIATFSSTMNKQPPPVVKLATSIPTKSKPFSASNDDYHYHKFPQTQNKLQNIVMWRDIPKSALMFGIGAFIIISSSYTQDLNISFISVISYMGLVYLAAIFLYRSILCRGVVEIDESNCVVGEEEAIWLLKLVLPYLNEFLLKLRALFSGDPSTTMKMAVLLFVLARCGSSITIWKMAKLGFFGVFIVLKLCTSYSHQLTAYGKFWIGRFRDAWESCTHKKAVAMVLFTLVWNLCSTLARIWAAFMLFVALRYYQQKMTDEWMEREEGLCGNGSSIGNLRQRHHRLNTSKVEPLKVKSGF